MTDLRVGKDAQISSQSIARLTSQINIPCAQIVKMISPLPAPNRIVTGHADDGSSTITAEGPAQFSRLNTASLTQMSIAWDSLFPSPLSGEDTGKPGGGLPIYDSDKTRFWITDTPPHGQSPMHRTVSLDYGICIAGELTLLLDDGSERVLKPGDVVVQRGTMHQWFNRTDQWCRMAFICCGAKEPFVVNGSELKTEFQS
ncbi:hypothetical protein BD324DRAFT_640328 [Kockovaella imperatae]|uniref:Cupin type-2 domain-containing protein n=1 Tax=Kockovaella imperatae TaxID=4999 RepID=A0A1Y1U5K7_9TREE|nr:hypothetical protein BD324DRAFT_640328 [Kockovaella imperatae]ORX33272.1 hypothetical protein BD324DRAFT_640328 [Kockovaella imperatae]